MTSTQPKLPLLIANEFHRDTIARLDTLFDTHKLWLLPPADQAALVEQLKPHCQAVASASWATNPLVYDLPGLQIIACFGVGVDGIDFARTRPRAIAVTNTPGVLNDAVADIALALVLATQRNLVSADQHVRSGAWAQQPFPLGRSLAGQTLGIIGLGSIGADIAARAETFKLKIAYHNRQPKDCPYQYYPDLVSLSEHADILLCVLPGGAETDKVVNAGVFEALGKDGTFINVGRGSSVDEDALIHALRHGVIGGAGLDVYQNEPTIRPELLTLPNVVLLPHIGSATVETRAAMGQLVVDNLLAWSRGDTLLTPC